MARIRNAQQMRSRIRFTRDRDGARYRQQTANTVGGMARSAQNSVSYRGRRELNYTYENRDSRTDIQKRIDRVTGVTPNGQSREVEVGYRANRMAQAVRTFASAPQPSGGSGSNSKEA